MNGQWPNELKHLLGPGAKAPGPGDLTHLIRFFNELKKCGEDVTPQVMSECLRRLARHLKDRRRTLDEKRAMFDDYQRLLGKFSRGAWAMGTDALLLSLEWFPTIGQLNEALREAEDRLVTRRSLTQQMITIASVPSSPTSSAASTVVPISFPTPTSSRQIRTPSSTDQSSSGSSIIAGSIRRISAE